MFPRTTFFYAKIALVLAGSVFSLGASAACPQLAGRYRCPIFGVDLTITQTNKGDHTVYKNLNTNEVVETDGKLHAYLQTVGTYRATCKDNLLVYDIYSFNKTQGKFVHEHQTWGRVGKKLELPSTIVRIAPKLPESEVEEMPKVICFLLNSRR